MHIGDEMPPRITRFQQIVPILAGVAGALLAIVGILRSAGDPILISILLLATGIMGWACRKWYQSHQRPFYATDFRPITGDSSRGVYPDRFADSGILAAAHYPGAL